MKYLYVSLIGRSSAAGVIKKVIAKVTTLRQYLDIEGLIMLRDIEHIDQYGQIEGIHFSMIKTHYTDLLKEFLESRSFGLVFMRYPGGSRALLRFLDQEKPRLLFEHNSKEIEEKRFYLKSFKLKDYLYQLSRGQKNLLQHWRYLYEEWKWGPVCLARAKGGIAVTHEIAAYEENRCKSYKVAVIPNGIDFTGIQARTAPLFDESTGLTLLFSSGSANAWHGLDRFLTGLSNYKGKTPVTLYIVGLYLYHYQPLIDQLNHRENLEVICTGLVNKEEMSIYMAKAHIGIGSLGLHRIPLKEASTLKVREYCSVGLPFIISHEDVDLELHPEFKPFYQTFAANDSPIDLSLVLDFAHELYQIEQFELELRKLAEMHLSTDAKMKTLAGILAAYAQKESPTLAHS